MQIYASILIDMSNGFSSLSLSFIAVVIKIFDFQIFGAPNEVSSLMRRDSVDFLLSVPRCGNIFNGGMFGCSMRVGDDTSGLGELLDKVPIISCGSW